MQKILNNFVAIPILLLVFLPQPLSIPVKSREFSGVVLGETYQKELQCLKEAAYYEAANQPEEGIRAVLQVIKNRKESKDFPSSFCKVVHQPKQFSYRNNLKPGEVKEIKIKNSLDKQALERIHYLSELTAQGTLKQTLPPETLYYAKIGVKIRLMKKIQKVVVIDKHVFYKEI